MADLQPKEQEHFDLTNESPFLSFIRSLPEKLPTTIRIFDRNDFYSCHGDDALFAAKEIFKTTAVVKYFGKDPNKLASVVLSKSNFEAFARDLLLVKQYRIELYRNQNQGKKTENWTMEVKASPGNLGEFEDVLFANNDMTSSCGVMGVKINSSGAQMNVGIGFIDTMNRKFVVCDFVDDAYFTTFEALLIQLSVKECVIPTSDLNNNYSEIKRLLERATVLINERKKSDFTNDVAQDLNRLIRFGKNVQPNSSALPEMENVLGISALAAGIKYLELLNDKSNWDQFKLQAINLTQFLRLDIAAMRALNVFSQPGDQNESQNLYGLLNKCRTGQGQRLLRQWIKQPLMDLNKIEERQHIVSAFHDDAILRSTLYEDVLRRMPDFQRIAKRFYAQKTTLQDCFRVYQAVNRLPDLHSTLMRYDGPSRTALLECVSDPLMKSIINFKNYIDMINLTIDVKQAENGDFVLKAEFDDKLKDVFERIEAVEQRMESTLRKAASDLNLESGKTIKLESNPQLGYFFRVTRKEEQAIRQRKSYAIIDANKTAGVRFQNCDLRDLNAKYLVLRDEYKGIENGLMGEIKEICVGYCEPLNMLNDVVAQLDVLVALAVAAVNASTSYVKPKVLPKGSGVMILKQARHPCLEVQDGVEFIPNDFNFERNKTNFFIVTGPNMGGKSTYIRSVGVIALMAQIGSFVPCEAAEISIVDSILARVGAGDMPMKGVSTFMAEMLETASILRSATEDSLIIIDELGRGTSTYDGFGLAWAISDHIAREIRCFCLFASHFHELTTLADEIETVSNLHVVALTDSKRLTLLYQVAPGACDQSFGIHVAELANFPPEVIEMAKAKALELEDFQTGVLVGTPLEGSDQNAVNLRRKTKQEGEKLIMDFVEKVKGLPLDSMTEVDVQKRILEFKEEVLSHNNLYVADVLKRKFK